MNFEKQAKTNENKTWSDLILIWFDLNTDSILLMLFKIEKRERKNRDSDRSSIGYCLQYVQPTNTNTNIGTNWCKIIAVGKLKNKRQRTLGEINETFFSYSFGWRWWDLWWWWWWWQYYQYLWLVRSLSLVIFEKKKIKLNIDHWITRTVGMKSSMKSTIITIIIIFESHWIQVVQEFVILVRVVCWLTTFIVDFEFFSLKISSSHDTMNSDK